MPEAPTPRKHGGARPGSGRPPKPKPPTGPAGDLSPLEWLLAVMRDPTQTTARRMRCAIAALPYCHAKPVPVQPPKRTSAPAANVIDITPRFRPGDPPKPH